MNGHLPKTRHRKRLLNFVEKPKIIEKRVKPNTFSTAREMLGFAIFPYMHRVLKSGNLPINEINYCLLPLNPTYAINIELTLS